MSIHISAPRKVKEHRMFTVSGKPVYSLFTKHTLESAPHRTQAFTIDPLTTPFDIKRLQRAEEQVGEPCEWRFHRYTECMDVSF